MTTKIIITGILYIIALISGYVLSRAGRPLQEPLFTLHKLSALAAIVFTIIIGIQLQKPIALGQWQLIFIFATVVALLTSFTTGALLSFDKFALGLAKHIHTLSTYFLFMLTILTVYLLYKGIN